ncbi:uncharacterized protein J3R85_009339 [Psidium guajava]|nr:uncharacterized protein J3R85_009339 [Psidium guajava]
MTHKQSQEVEEVALRYRNEAIAVVWPEEKRQKVQLKPILKQLLGAVGKQDS